MLREDKLIPEANDSQTITEKTVPHRTGIINTITENQIDDAHVASKDDAHIIEKVLNEATGSYVDHRSAESNLLVPPLSALVEKNRIDRMSKEYKTDKVDNWTIEQKSENKDQQGALPAWPKHPSQNDISTGKIVLNNDPRRFESDNPRPLIGNITTADVHKIAGAIKTGETLDYDTAIVAILKQADDNERELSPVEQKTITDLKKARTAALLA